MHMVDFILLVFTACVFGLGFWAGKSLNTIKAAAVRARNWAFGLFE